MVDTAKLRGERLAEFEREREESNRRYDQAFAVVLSHTSAVELEEFWHLFSTDVTSDQHDDAQNNDSVVRAWSKSAVGGGSAELGELKLFEKLTSTFEGENPIALAGGTNESLVKTQESIDPGRAEEDAMVSQANPLHGLNGSLSPSTAAVRALRQRGGAQQPVVAHNQVL